MLATGGLLVSLALLALALLVPVFRRSDPPRWTTRGWIGEVATVAIVGTLALGVVCVGAGAIGAFRTGLRHLDLGLLAVVLVASIVMWRRLKAGTRKAAGSLAATASEPPQPHKAA